MKLRPDPGIIVEGPHADGHLGTIRPIAAKQTRAAFQAEGLHGTLSLPVSANQFLPGEKVELFLPHARLRANGGSRMLATTIAVAMARPNKRRFDFETHAAAKATASNDSTHATFCARHRQNGNSESRAAQKSALPVQSACFDSSSDEL
jgi:hypothetical protein